jgi:hypothetical protein
MMYLVTDFPDRHVVSVGAGLAGDLGLEPGHPAGLLLIAFSEISCP